MPMMGSAQMSGASLSERQAKFIQSAYECLDASEMVNDCLAVTFDCPADVFGTPEGAGRGWCEAIQRTFWGKAVLGAAEDRYLEWLVQTSRRDAVDAFKHEQRLFSEYRKQKCDRTALQNVTGVGSGESARTSCIMRSSAVRSRELIKSRSGVE